MSGDVQPRKRKDKRKKKGSLDARRNEEYSEESAIFQRQSSAASDEEVEFLQHQGSIGGSDEVIHVHKESKLGGNICSKIVFFGLLGALGVMVGLIIIEFHGANDVDTQSAANSPWSMMLEGWVDSSSGHDDHDEHTEHGDEHGEHDDEHGEHGDEHEDHDEGDHDKQHDGEEESKEDNFISRKLTNSKRLTYLLKEMRLKPVLKGDRKSDKILDSKPSLKGKNTFRTIEKNVVQHRANKYPSLLTLKDKKESNYLKNKNIYNKYKYDDEEESKEEKEEEDDDEEEKEDEDDEQENTKQNYDDDDEDNEEDDDNDEDNEEDADNDEDNEENDDNDEDDDEDNEDDDDEDNEEDDDEDNEEYDDNDEDNEDDGDEDNEEEDNIGDEDNVEDDDDDDDDDNEEEDNDDDDNEDDVIEKENEEEDDSKQDEDDEYNEEDDEKDVDDDDENEEEDDDKDVDDDDENEEEDEGTKQDNDDEDADDEEADDEEDNINFEVEDDDIDEKQGKFKYSSRKTDEIKRKSNDIKSKQKYLADLMKKLKKQEMKLNKYNTAKRINSRSKNDVDDDENEDDEETELKFKREANIASESEEEEEETDDYEEEEKDEAEEDTVTDNEELSEKEEDETSGVALKFGVGVALVFVAHVVLIRKWSDSGESGLAQATEEVPGGADVPPSYVERRQTLIPAEIMEDIPAAFRPAEGEYFEGEEHEEEEEPIEEVEEVSFVQQTYDDLRAAYNQITPEESEAELTEDTNAQLNEYEATESEPEPSETEEEEDDEEPQEDDPLGQWKSESGPELLAEGLDEVQTEEGTEEEETEEESEDEASSAPASGGPQSTEADEDQIVEDFVNDETVEPIEKLNESESKEEVYENSDITNQADWEFREDLDEADRQFDEGNPSSALSAHSVLLSRSPRSPRALYGRARALDRLAEIERSNARLLQAISAYTDALRAPDLPDALLLRIANRTINRMRFKGVYTQALEVHNLLIERFPDNITHQIDLGVTYLTLNRLDQARSVLEAAHVRWPQHALCRGYLGLALKLQGLHAPSVPHLNVTVHSNKPGTDDSRFYFHLGDALQRLRRNGDAMKIYELGVEKGIFRSKYQRSLYNVERLKAQPWWSLDKTTYGDFFRKLEAKWQIIKSEGLSVYKERKGYLDEAESLRDSGDWKQFELFARGQKYKQNCARTPVTCGIIEELAAARTCRRGQVKFSIMTGGTHVWPHCGPTNCRLRAHLGLIVPSGTSITVADQTRTWEEGKVMVFDDSFEHEVWHNGSAPRLVLIVDVWHPELTMQERATLSAI